MCSDSQERYSGKKDTVVHLKQELRKRKLAVSGRKQELVKRLRDYDAACNAAPVIQRHIRGWLVRIFIKSKGPGLWRRELCVNTRDFYTQQDVSKISLEQFFSIDDANGLIYGFDLVSFMNLRFGHGQVVRNPYTNKPTKPSADHLARQAIRLGRCLGMPVCTQIQIETEGEESKIVDFFQELASLSFTVNADWLSNMGDNTLRRFDYLLRLHWRRAAFSNELRTRICPPSGVLLTCDSRGLARDRAHFIDNVLAIGKQLSFSATSVEDRRLGATVFLSVLTKLSLPASRALPWLRTAADQLLFPDDYSR